MSTRFEAFLAGPEDDDELRRLLRENPMPGDIALTLEREPSFFHGAAIEGEVHHTITGRDDATGRLVGVGSIAAREVYLGGVPRRFGYLSQLRVDQRFRYHSKLLRRGFELLRDLDAQLDVPGFFTTIFEDNLLARAALEKDRPFKPCYRRIGTLVTLALPLWRRLRVAAPTGVEVRAARKDDLDAIVACLARNHRRHPLAPVWRAASLTHAERARGLALEDFTLAVRGDQVVACLARWDQQAFKQTLVRGYAGRMAFARPLVKLGAPIFGWPRFPKPGQALSHAYLSHVAVDDDDPALLLPLVAQAFNDSFDRGYAYLTTGFFEGTPLLAALKQRCFHLEYRALAYLVHWAHRPAPTVEGLPHLEVAVL